MIKLLGIAFAGLMVLAIAGCDLEDSTVEETTPTTRFVQTTTTLAAPRTVATTRATTTTTQPATTTTTLSVEDKAYIHEAACELSTNSALDAGLSYIATQAPDHLQEALTINTTFYWSGVYEICLEMGPDRVEEFDATFFDETTEFSEDVTNGYNLAQSFNRDDLALLFCGVGNSIDLDLC